MAETSFFASAALFYSPSAASSFESHVRLPCPIAHAGGMHKMCTGRVETDIRADTLRKRDGPELEAEAEQRVDAESAQHRPPSFCTFFHSVARVGTREDEEGWQLGRHAVMRALFPVLARECAFTMAIYSPLKEVLRENLNF